MSGPLHSRHQRFIFSGFLCLSFALFHVCESVAQAPPGNDLEKAITFLQQIDPAKVKLDDQEKVAKEIDAAWSTIRKAGPPGVARLKREITRPGQTDYFRLNGAALLWGISEFDEAEFIAGVWRATKLEVQSNYVFYPAFHAAIKQDSRALPMLLAILGNNKFEVYFPRHAMDVKWPMTTHFVWGAYGPKRLPVLLNVLKTSENLIELQSALFLFANDLYLDALPRIRELARSNDGDTRRAAIYALGFYGHPQDYDFLIAGLRSADAEDRFYFGMALYEYEDLRAVPHLIPLLDDPERKNRREAAAALTHLLTSQSIDALVKYTQRAQGEEKAEVARYLESEFKEYGFTLSAYLKKTPLHKAQAIDTIRQRREALRFLPRSGEKRFTRSEFLQAAEAWKKSHHMRMAVGEMPVEARQILTAATVDDINLLLEVKAAVLARLSDECLYEARRIDTVVRRLGRSRYRKDVGITEKVEAP